jgi:hypothetical protein
MRRISFNNVAAIGALGLIAAYYATSREVAPKIGRERNKTSRRLPPAEVL